MIDGQRLSSPAVERARERTESRRLAGAGLTLGRLFGVAIELDWSLLIVFSLVAFNLGAGLLPAWHPEWGRLLIWGVALAAAVLFFASILVHELCHALVARRNGVPVDRITLFLFGGVAQLEREPHSPKVELAIAIVGPIASLLIGLGATAAGMYLTGDALPFDASEAPRDQGELRSAMSRVGPLATLLLWLGPINVTLALFNVVPGFPLDGGRVLRAVLWWTTGDLVKATRWASGVGRVFAWLLMAAGVMHLFAGAFSQGTWLLLIGWFLLGAARTSYEQVLTRRALAGVPVERVMWTHVEGVPPELTLERFVGRQALARDQAVFPVERGGELLGLISIDDVRRVPHQEWGSTTVARMMKPVQELPTLRPHEQAEHALDVLAHSEIDQIPVLDGPRLQGVVRMRDLLRWIALQDPARSG